jgi:hypothetical protein
MGNKQKNQKKQNKKKREDVSNISMTNRVS